MTDWLAIGLACVVVLGAWALRDTVSELARERRKVARLEHEVANLEQIISLIRETKERGH